MFSNEERCHDMSGMHPEMMVNMPVNPMFDLNQDNQVDSQDLGIFKNAMQMGATAPATAGGMMTPGCAMPPIVHPGKERVVCRTICHNVQHICPVRTRIINNHVFKHTYRPEYSCCEENQVSHINEGSCDCF